MPYELTRRPDGGVVCEFRGVITLEGNLAARGEMSGGKPENFSKIPYLLVDHSKTRKARHSAEDMKKLAETLNSEVRRYNPEILVALVVPKDFTFGLARMYHTYAGGDHSVGLFRTRKGAEAWIAERMAGANSGSRLNTPPGGDHGI